ncbi:MAG TPA: VF530 family protein [Myxococcota bacterium]|nr:VF530 family protein [Myxococcota bacterium]
MSEEQPKNKLHGITLERIVTELVEYFGWEELGRQVRIRCFQESPSVGSSLKFLRRTPWAREKVESLYLFMGRQKLRAEREGRAVGPRPAVEGGRDRGE